MKTRLLLLSVLVCCPMLFAEQPKWEILNDDLRKDLGLTTYSVKPSLAENEALVVIQRSKSKEGDVFTDARISWGSHSEYRKAILEPSLLNPSSRNLYLRTNGNAREMKNSRVKSTHISKSKLKIIFSAWDGSVPFSELELMAEVWSLEKLAARWPDAAKSASESQGGAYGVIVEPIE